MPRYVWGGSLWTMRQNKPIVVMFGRDIDNPTITKAIGFGNQRPYFYAPSNEVPAVMEKNPNHMILDVEEGHLDAFGRSITKCYTRIPSDVPIAREKFSFTCEADIPYDMRYKIDHRIFYAFSDKGDPIDVPMMSPRWCGFDIETNAPLNIMPRAEDAKWPICQIQVYDSYTKQIKVFTTGYDQVDDEQVNFETEEEVLSAFTRWVWDTDPDLLVGWNINNFDMPYIFSRARRLGVDMSRMSRWPSVYPTADKCTGREIFDMYTFYKDWSKPKGQLPSYTLKYVVKHETGYVYDNQGDKIRSLVDAKNWTALVSYGKSDVLALAKIEEETGLIDFYEALRRMIGCRITDCLQRSKMVELFLMHKGIKPLITKRHDAAKSEYAGALVLQPTFGIHKWVGTTDLKALYPSIILAFNISPDIDKMIPKVITELMEARDFMRRLKMECKASKAMLTSEQSLKYVINAFYGYLAYPGARLFKPELAAFITEKGREISLSLHKQLHKMNLEIVYGDTDSTFVKPVRTAEEGKYIQDTLNAYLLEWARSVSVKDEFAPTLKLEKIYSTLMFKKKSDSEEAAKKRYAGVLVWKDGKDLTTKPPEVDYTGLEVKRSDTAEITRTLMKEFFPAVLIEDNIPKAIAMVKLAYYKVLRGEATVQEISIPKGVTKGQTHTTPGASPWVRGKETGRVLLGIKFDTDKKPKLIYCHGHPDVICIDDDTLDKDVKQVCKIDWSHMANATITAKMKSLLESIGISWEVEILGQTGLGKWMT